MELEAILPCLCPSVSPGPGNLWLQPVRHRELGLWNADSPSGRCVCQGNPAPSTKAQRVPSDWADIPNAIPRKSSPRLCAAQAGNVGARACEHYVQIAHIGSQSCSQEPEHCCWQPACRRTPIFHADMARNQPCFPFTRGGSKTTQRSVTAYMRHLCKLA